MIVRLHCKSESGIGKHASSSLGNVGYRLHYFGLGWLEREPASGEERTCQCADDLRGDESRHVGGTNPSESIAGRECPKVGKSKQVKSKQVRVGSENLQKKMISAKDSTEYTL
jgi:hypothetical protein